MDKSSKKVKEVKKIKIALLMQQMSKRQKLLQRIMLKLQITTSLYNLSLLKMLNRVRINETSTAKSIDQKCIWMD